MSLRDWTLQYNMIWAAMAQPPGDCLCPQGYESVGDECMKVSTKPAGDPDFTPLKLVPYTYTWYSDFGTLIYDPLYNLDGTGSSTRYYGGNGYPFWEANPGEGPMNRCSIWSESYSANQQIGFAVCFNIPKEKTYLVGFGVDNYATIRIDGTPVIQMPKQSVQATFKYFHVYPVTIKKGLHILEIIACNVYSIAAIGAEIYDATPAELMAIDNETDLDQVIVFSTKNMVDEFTNLGTNGYPIDPEFALATCWGDPFFYRKVEYTPCL